MPVMTMAICMDNMPFLMIFIFNIRNYNNKTLNMVSYFIHHLFESFFFIMCISVS